MAYVSNPRPPAAECGNITGQPTPQDPFEMFAADENADDPVPNSTPKSVAAVHDRAKSISKLDDSAATYEIEIFCSPFRSPWSPTRRLLKNRDN